MALTNDLISQFVKATSDSKKSSKEETLYGTAKVQNGTKYVQLDGSTVLTPISSTANVLDGERVTVMIKNHTAVITGNLSSPSARVDDLAGLDEAASKIEEFEIIIAKKADAEELTATNGRIDSLVIDNVLIRQTLEANTENINDLTADNVEIKKTLTANSADIENLKHEPKILWGGDLPSGMHMTADHTINLSEAVSAQRHGIVLVFCAYDSVDETNYSWQSFFVPKQLVALSTSEHTFVLGRGKFTYIGTKYLYIGDTSISGHADNNLTGSNNGITYANNKFVLRYVIGV